MVVSLNKRLVVGIDTKLDTERFDSIRNIISYLEDIDITHNELISVSCQLYEEGYS